jgi:hypothetical protein
VERDAAFDEKTIHEKMVRFASRIKSSHSGRVQSGSATDARNDKRRRSNPAVFQAGHSGQWSGRIR